MAAKITVFESCIYSSNCTQSCSLRKTFHIHHEASFPVPRLKAVLSRSRHLSAGSRPLPSSEWAFTGFLFTQQVIALKKVWDCSTGFNRVFHAVYTFWCPPVSGQSSFTWSSGYVIQSNSWATEFRVLNPDRRPFWLLQGITVQPRMLPSKTVAGHRGKPSSFRRLHAHMRTFIGFLSERNGASVIFRQARSPSRYGQHMKARWTAWALLIMRHLRIIRRLNCIQPGRGNV